MATRSVVVAAWAQRGAAHLMVSPETKEAATDTLGLGVGVGVGLGALLEDAQHGH